MKSLLAILAITTALTLPGLAMARPVTLTTTLSNYGGDGAYLALYVTDAQGAYVGSLWMAGAKSKYYEHLSGWYRATGGNVAEIDGITGATRTSNAVTQMVRFWTGPKGYGPLMTAIRRGEF